MMAISFFPCIPGQGSSGTCREDHAYSRPQSVRCFCVWSVAFVFGRHCLCARCVAFEESPADYCAKYENAFNLELASTATSSTSGVVSCVIHVSTIYSIKL